MSTSTERNGVSLQRLILAPQRRVLRPLASAITSRTHCADAAVRNPCKKENPPQTNPQRPLASSSPKTHFLDHWGLIISLGNPLRSPFPPHSKTHLLIMRLSRGQDPSMCVVPSFPFHLQGRKRTPPPQQSPNRTTKYFANRTHGMIDVVVIVVGTRGLN